MESSVASVVALLIAGAAPQGTSNQSPPDDAVRVNGSATLARLLDAHGGLENWRRQGTLRYTLLDFPLTPVVAQPNTATIDLHSRAIRIESQAFGIVHDGARTWAAPTAGFIGLPPRFYAKGSSYFVLMPWVFADGGVDATDAGQLEYAGKRYDLVNVSYRAGVGDVQDGYQLLVDPETHRLHAINHSVNEIDIERVTWVFDQWQEVDGLLIPSAMTFRPGFDPQNPGEGKTARVTEAALSTERPAPETFTTPPAGAVEVK